MAFSLQSRLCNPASRKATSFLTRGLFSAARPLDSLGIRRRRASPQERPEAPAKIVGLSTPTNPPFAPSRSATGTPTFASTVAACRHSFEAYDPKANGERPLIIKDAGVVDRQFKRWVSNLPRVRPFYAVKCNPDDTYLAQLTKNGAGFDCATAAEIDAVLAQGVDPSDIIFANPIKSLPDIQHARDVGVKKMTFDNEAELFKIQALFPEAELVLRLLPDDSGSLMRFGAKFGASLDKCKGLLALSKEHDMSVIGVSFHIGSGCFDPLKYDGAIELARTVFDMAEDMGLPAMHLLDVGGGFPGDPNPHQVGRDGVPAFESFAQVIETAMDKYFPESSYPNLQAISEPGRYFVHAAGTLFTQVAGKRMNTSDNILYYINDGVYGSFNSIMFDHAKPIPIPLDEYFEKQRCEFESIVHETKQQPRHAVAQAHNFSTSTKTLPLSTIFGPTCDSLDKIIEHHPLREMHIGDWLVFDHMGAYTTAAASTFNGVPRPIEAEVFSLSN